jgi:outer membrane immunogenic protein
MNTLKSIFVGTALLIGAGAFSAASAGDLYSGRGSLKDDGVRPAISWTGFYLGVHAGGSFDDGTDITKGDVRYTTGAPYYTPETRTTDIDGAGLGGVQAGLNYQISRVVLGIEGDYSKSGADKTDYIASVRGRLGLAFGNSLFYGTGGAAFLQWDNGVRFDMSNGWVAGGGFEHKLAPNLSLGLEGLYYSFEDNDKNVQPSQDFITSYDVDRDFYTVRARLNYHLTTSGAGPLK